MTEGVGNVAVLAALAVVPLVVLMLTSFVKISVVLSLVRNAIGAPDAPSGLIVMGLSLILTVFVMSPVAIAMVRAGAAAPAAISAPPPPPATTPRDPQPGELWQAVREVVPARYHAELDAAERAAAPLRAFLRRHAGERDRATFAGLAAGMGHPVAGDELWVLAPAFLSSELRAAFAIAVLIFLPFLVIDLVVGLGLAALGLASTSPQTVALPLKLLLFVAVDGWRLLLDSLLRGYV